MCDIDYGTKKQVILVEDDDAYRYVLARELRNLGLDIIDVYSALEALDILDRHPTIRKAVVDLGMPPQTLTGLGFARMMRHRNRAARVVLITGYPEYLEIEEGAPFGGVLFKPADARVLVAAIHERLSPPWLDENDGLPGQPDGSADSTDASPSG